MPIYEYACPRCGRSFEELVVRRSDEADVRCPGCGASDVARQMSRPASVGSGAGSSAPTSRGCGPVG
jgi:putative FmdB family regulatory protein